MKHIIALIFLFLLLSCTGRQNLNCREPNPNDHLESKTEDVKCLEIRYKADDEAEASGFCYTGPLLKGRDPGAIEPDPEKCNAFYEEAAKKCADLPPLSERPEDLIQVSGSAIYRGGKPIMIDGKPVCP